MTGKPTNLARAKLDGKRRAATVPPLREATSPGAFVLFDLDGTITRRDTYLAYLLGFLARHPERLLRAAPLSLAALRYLIGERDNTWLKTTFLRAILGSIPRRLL